MRCARPTRIMDDDDNVCAAGALPHAVADDFDRTDRPSRDYNQTRCRKTDTRRVKASDVFPGGGERGVYR